MAHPQNQIPLETSQKWLIFILGTLIAIGPLSIDMYLPAFQDISKKFQVSIGKVELSLASFFIGISLGQLFYGTLTDRYGRKLPLYFGLLVYLLASLACAFAPNIEILIGLRFLQAIGACAGMVVSRAMVRDLFDHTQSARVFSLLLLVMGVAPILAPLMGGYISLAFGWRSIFLALAGFSFLCLFLVYYALPETRSPNPAVKLKNTLSTYANIISRRSFLGYALSSGFGSAGLFAYITGSPAVIMEHFAVSPQHYGWIFSANAIGLIGLSQFNRVLLRKHHPDTLLTYSYIIMSLLGASLAVVGFFDLGLLPLLIVLFFYLSQIGITNPNASAGALAEHGNSAGSASALLGTVQFLAAALSSGAVSYWHSGTAIPMSLIMAACSGFALVSYGLLVGFSWSEARVYKAI